MKAKTSVYKKTKSSVNPFSNLMVVLFILLVLGILTYTFLQQPKPQPVTDSAKIAQTLPGGLDISLCDPAKGQFTQNITNPYFPLPTGMVHVLENSTSKVQMTVLDRTIFIAGVEARVLEEREWENGQLSETSDNYFVQASDGTVCYYGEDVDVYKDGQVINHEGSWRAGVNNAKPGIQMPAQPQAGQKYAMEVAPRIAEDIAEHTSMISSLTTSAGTFNNVLVVKETPASDKKYAPGVGLIFDDGAELSSY